MVGIHQAVINEHLLQVRNTTGADARAGTWSTEDLGEVVARPLDSSDLQSSRSRETYSRLGEEVDMTTLDTNGLKVQTSDTKISTIDRKPDPHLLSQISLLPDPVVAEETGKKKKTRKKGRHADGHRLTSIDDIFESLI